MNWKKFLSYKHHHLPAHHHYQMACIFLFIFGFFFFFPYYIIMSEYNLDMQTYQWYFFIPWMLFYIIYCLKERIKIGEEERVGPMKRPIIHWIILGLSIVYMATQSNDLEKLQSLYYAFIIFSLFVADGYWDFRKTKLWKKHGKS